MFTAEFDFNLPHELIAQYPIEPRHGSRLMVVDRKRGCWEHRVFAELPQILDPPDILVRNDTMVVQARLVGYRASTGGKWEGLFLRERPGGSWDVLATTRGQPTVGEHVVVGQGLRLVLEARGDAGSWVVRPERDSDGDEPAYTLLDRHGQTPLPSYIRQGREIPDDQLAYQTVYARRPGSVAAPTAGLHFTDQTFKQLAARGIAWVDLTLHVGSGTFRPIKTRCLSQHIMHAEWAALSAEAVGLLKLRRSAGGRIVAVGSTSARTLETAAAGAILKPFVGETQLFIQPGHAFRAVDALVTNFHLPRSSLLVLVSAFAGLDLTRAVYAEAIRRRYRFFSYGDAMLIL
jgi:S-adenosylmethionine:tRNA ribosyltransferase-isomerase